MTDGKSFDLLRRCEENANAVAARSREVIEVGPFRAMLDRTTEMVWMNYAVPIAPLYGRSDMERALTELRSVFVERGRTPRFEFTEELWPELAGVLEDTGFQLQVKHPTMICTPKSSTPVHAPEIEVHLLTRDDPDNVLARFQMVQHAAFSEEVGDSEGMSPEQIARLRDAITSERLRCAAALFEGTMASAGCTTPLEDICELAGVGTLKDYRRRGLAATLSSWLVEDHFGRGGSLVWLSAGDAIAQAVYEKIGFYVVGTRLNYIFD